MLIDGNKKKLKICISASNAGTHLTNGLWSIARSEDRYALAWAELLAHEGHDITVDGEVAEWGCCSPLSNVRLQNIRTQREAAPEEYDVYLSTSLLPNSQISNYKAKIEIHVLWQSLFKKIKTYFPASKGLILKSNQYLVYVCEFNKDVEEDNRRFGAVSYLPHPVAPGFSESGYSRKEITLNSRITNAPVSIRVVKEQVLAMLDVANDFDLTCNFLMTDILSEAITSEKELKDLMMSAKKKNLYDSLPFNQYMDILGGSKAAVSVGMGPSAHLDPIFKGALPIMWGFQSVFDNVGEKYGWKSPSGYDIIKKILYNDIFKSEERYNTILYSCQDKIKDNLWSNSIKYFNKLIERGTEAGFL